MVTREVGRTVPFIERIAVGSFVYGEEGVSEVDPIRIIWSAMWPHNAVFGCVHAASGHDVGMVGVKNY